MFRAYYNLPREVYILSAAVAVFRAGSFVMPFLTLYLSKKMGMSNEMIGVYVMLSLVAAACGGICGGFLADKIGRKKVIVYSQLIAAALVFTCLFLQGTMILPAVLIAAAFFHMGMNPAMNALVADVTKPEVRTVSFSLIYLAINVGAAIGPLVAGFLFNHYINLLFILDAVITVIATCVVIFFVKETIPQKPKKEKTETSTTSQNSKWKELAFLFSFRLLIMFGIVLGFANVTYAQHYYSVPLFINQIFGEEGPAIFGSIITINCVVVLVCTVFVTSIIKRFKPLINTLIGVVLQGFGMVLLFTAHSYLFLAVYTVVFTLGEIVLATSTNVFIASKAPEDYRGRINSVVFAFAQLGAALAPTLMGIYLKYSELNTVWFPLLILNILTTLLVFVVYLWDKRSSLNNKEVI